MLKEQLYAFSRFFRFIFQQRVDIPFPVQNAEDAQIVVSNEIVDADGRKSCHRPRSQPSQFRILYQFWRAYAGPLAYLADCVLYSRQEAVSHDTVIFLKEEISVLTQDVIAR
jgi:hypothetical protein